jgi:hypothetical protein
MARAAIINTEPATDDNWLDDSFPSASELPTGWRIEPEMRPPVPPKRRSDPIEEGPQATGRYFLVEDADSGSLWYGKTMLGSLWGPASIGFDSEAEARRACELFTQMRSEQRVEADRIEFRKCSLGDLPLAFGPGFTSASSVKLQLTLTDTDARKLSSLLQGLQTSGAAYAPGQAVEKPADVIRFLLFRLPDPDDLAGNPFYSGGR